MVFQVSGDAFSLIDAFRSGHATIIDSIDVNKCEEIVIRFRSSLYRDGRAAQWLNEPYLVIGVEKHDYDRITYPSFNGWIDEVRISNALRYTASFARPTQPFTPDALTAALYYFDEGTGLIVNDTSGAVGGPASGTLFVDPLSGGPAWSTETPPWTGNLPTSTPVPTATNTPAEGPAENLLQNGGFELDANSDTRPDN